MRLLYCNLRLFVKSEIRPVFSSVAWTLPLRKTIENDLGHVRFGIFEFDLACRELRRQGVAIRLQAQPARVLAALLEHPGEVVTRETLRHAVWGNETFVEFDGSLNFCIAQIRAALGDSAESPCFVRTIPKRGYQFIAPVSPVDVPTPPRRREWIWPAL